MTTPRQRMTLHDRTGAPIDVPKRGALPETARRVRYPGFKQERTVLPKGSVRIPGYLPLSCDILLERDVPVALRDGTVVYVDVLRPVDDAQEASDTEHPDTTRPAATGCPADGRPTATGRPAAERPTTAGNHAGRPAKRPSANGHPAIVAMSPYGKEIGGQWLDDIPGRSGVKKSQTSGLQTFEGPDPAYWVAHDYAVVNVDVRGAYRSEGVIRFFGSGYGRDGADLVEWVAAQPWCNGRVGMSGNSWLAISQWFTAAERPPHLAAIAPWEGLTDSLTQVATHGGVPTAEFVELLSDTFCSSAEGGIEDSIGAMAEHPVRDAYWEDKAAALERIDVPAYIVGSWTNMIHTYGTFDAWRRISSADKWLRVHNTNEWNDYYTPESVEDLRRFFDCYLKGEDNGWRDTPRVRLSLLNPGGVDVVGRPEKAFPLARTHYEKLYLDAGSGALCRDPGQAAASVTYDSDRARGKAVFTLRVRKRTEICGYLSLRLWVSPLDTDDMDLRVTLDKRGPFGTTYHGIVGSDPAAVGFIRASMRELDPARSTPEDPVLAMRSIRKVAPGEAVPVDIAIWPTGMVFEPGNVMRLTIRAHKTDPRPKGPMAAMFGHAKVKIPADRFTALPGARTPLITLGGDSRQTAPDAKDAKIPQDVNRGRHRILTGGEHESYLYLPIISPSEESEA